MVRRKSLNRRFSRYSRNSTGSAVLDPNTENLGDEQPYWWKNLENNTVMRPSMSSNAPNHTSTILDPNSGIDLDDLQDGWWKVLETTDDAKLTMPTRRPDADSNTVTTSESDEEPRIIKKKVTLRSAARKSRGNPFVNISESETSDKKKTRESLMNKSGFIDKGSTSSKRVNRISESRSGQSDSTDAVLKLKPTLFKRRHKDRQRNVFDDVLKENELLTPSRRKSLKLSSHSKTGTLMENKIPAIIDSPIVKQGGTRQLVLSFENDHDLSHLPNPEAQSTLLESSLSSQGSNKDSNNSKMEARVLKPKSTFLKRRKRGADRNVFADIFAEEETHNDVEMRKRKEKGIDANAEASKAGSVGQAGGSFRGSQSTPSNVVNEIRTGDARATKGLRSTEAITPSAQDPRGSVEPNALAQASIASSDTSDKSQDHNMFLKPRSTFLKGSRKRPDRNIFEEILEEVDNVDALSRSRSDILINRAKEDVMMKNQATVARETRRLGIIDQESNTGSEELHLQLAGSSEEDIAWPDGNNAKKTSGLYRSTYSDIEVSELSLERRSALHVSPEIPEMSNRKTASLPRTINEVSKSGGGGTWNVRHREAASDVDMSVTSKYEAGNHAKSHSLNQHERDVLEENNASSHKLHTQLSIDTLADFDQESKVIERTRRKDTGKLRILSFRTSLDDSESDDLQSTPSRPNKKLRTSIRQSTVVTHRDTDLEPVLSTPKRQSRSLSKSQKLLSSRVLCESQKEDVQEISRVISEAEVEDVQATPKRQSRNSNRSQKLLSSRVISEDEAEDVEATPKRQSRNSNRSQKLLSSRVISEAAVEDVQPTPKRQSKSSTQPQKLLRSRVVSEDEAEKVQATSKRQSRSLSRSQKWLSFRGRTRESKSADKAQKRSTSNAINEFEAQDPKTPERQSKVLSKLPNDISSTANQIEPCEIDGGAKRQSKSITRLERQSTVRIVKMSETNDVEINRQKHSKNIMSREPSISPVRGESQLPVPITGESNMHRVQEEEEEEEGGIDAGAKSFSATRRSEQRVTFNPNVTEDREDEDLLNASSKNGKEAKEVARNVGKNRSVALGKVKGSVGSTKTSTKRGKDSSRCQRNIEDFLIPASQVFADKEKMGKLMRELEKIKKQAMDEMERDSRKGWLSLQQKKPSNLVKTAKATQKQGSAKPIHKAFLVNGQVYKVARLPRPKYWVTDRLYKYLWKQLEPKYALQTRVISEKFVIQLSNVMGYIDKQKSYTSYRAELHALMKEMARLGIISTRFEFYYNFCYEFLPYALRAKVVPMLLPGNKRNIPYDKNQLHEPLLRA